MTVELTKDLGYIRKGTKFTMTGTRWYYPVDSLDIDANACLTVEYVKAKPSLFKVVKNDTNSRVKQVHTVA